MTGNSALRYLPKAMYGAVRYIHFPRLQTQDPRSVTDALVLFWNRHVPWQVIPARAFIDE